MRQNSIASSSMPSTVSVVGSVAESDPAVVKVVRAASGRALYFSRAKIPYKRSGLPETDELKREPYLRHVGLYTYSRDALDRWVALAPTELEAAERLEQLRPIEAGIGIGVTVVGAADPGVDTLADVERMEERLMELGLLKPYARQAL
jgi:3-deoxy-manno-octulosonate cytidylyltransferase (CMP-KDO synthetase)